LPLYFLFEMKYYELMPKKKKRKRLVFDEEIYRSLGINNLILFSLYCLEAEKKKATFEKLLEKCFVLFPKVFSLNTIPQWPDARKLDRPLRALRNKKFIKGDPSSNFSLTLLGEKKAKEIAKSLVQKKLL